MSTKKIIYTLVACIFMQSFISCNDDFVNTQPLGEVPKEVTWSDPALAEAFVFDIYNGLGQGGFDEEMQSSLTDESMFTHPGRGINTITESRSNPADQGMIKDSYGYGPLYGRIRACNIAIENLTEPLFSDPTRANNLLGQAYFLRAYYYQQLLRFYGGIPLIDRVYELGEADYSAARNSYEECVNFIVNDCDRAAELLAGTSGGQGRATGVAALALKARVLLYAASDLHDIPTASGRASSIAGYNEKQFLGYSSGSRAERWQKAKEAAFEVVRLTNFGYELNLSAPASVAEGTENYMVLSLGGGSKTVSSDGQQELLLGRYFIDLKDEAGNYIGRNNGPNGYHNWAGNTPIQNLVDDYEMVDGSRFSWENATHRASPYQNRDPRFYATILYDGADWKPRTADVAGRDPFNQIQTGRYQITNAAGAVVAHPGLDTRNSPIEDWNGSYTGYYFRKFTDPDPAVVDQNTRQFIPWPVLKYTEAVLNYVEACIELGEDAEAKTWLNKIRFRAGMPAITEVGDQLRTRYRNERRIELAFEEHRFFDTRRWMIAPQTTGAKIRLIRVVGALKPGVQVRTYQYNTDNYTYTYTPVELEPGIENRQWQDKMYFMPFHRDETNRNIKLAQNPAYD
ncbi:RagB/SusD family nutrient uptake outer membrane protein [Sphingobacterium sp. lm-10]|uniref:RagB/SusD family nutrient uptake outer membrane protein n=1 Tax=Sphingobacterium sp. lm-10 TaxID=2944904 RepID=UPI0020209A6E|nr:RagB/SusD family nutrient uptake outer membrane protein [Sphingobacterium sp. lm-10]MCL7987514.1 RagB/SusD family nutrient uptake outer membrane protein [Sphingobacterium sp. lm-10]